MTNRCRTTRRPGPCGWLRLVCVAVGMWLPGRAASAADQQPARPPNLVVILADDLGYGDVGCFGQEKLKTPRLDAMAAAGMPFTQFYAGAPVCAPSRCVLLTGRHTGRSGKTPWRPSHGGRA